MTFRILDGVDLNGQRAQNAADPTSSTDLATKQYVDNQAANLSPKDSVVACPTTNVTISSPGTSTFDGVTVPSGGRVALMNQTSAAENGIYQFNGASSAMTRTTDANTGAALQGAFFTIDQGTTYGDQMWYVTTDNITLGTTSIAFAKFAPGSSYTGSNGVQVSGTAISGVAAPGGGLSAGGTGFALDTTVAVRKYSANIGDGSTNPITVTHSLGTKDVVVELRDNANDQLVHLGGIVATTSSAVTLTFPTAPASNAYRVTVHA